MKKLLALVLALVMTLGLATVGANAAYPDAADVTLDEAVDVMSAVGVFKGDEKGNFKPTAALDRASAAKLIAYLDLGESVAEALPAIKVFDDVPATHWAAKYIAYCADAGYISGDGNGNFLPAGELTGYAFGKMILCVLGYNSEYEEFTGANWSIAVAKLMQKNDIANGVESAASATLTREQAAQYCLNALKADCVVYAGSPTTIEGNGIKVTTGTPTRTVDTEGASQEMWSATGYATENAATTLQLGEKLYGTKLVISKSTDDFGAPANIWTWKTTTTIGKFATEPAVTFTSATKAANVAAALGNYTLNDGTSDKKVNNVTTVTGTATGVVYANSTTGTNLAITAETIAKAIADETANGKYVAIYADSNNKITNIVELTYTVAKVSNITTNKTGTTYSFSVAGLNGVDYSDGTDDTIEINGTIAKGDYVTGVKVGTVSYIYPTTSFSGTQTSKTTDNKVTISGTVYSVGAGVTGVATFNNSDKSAVYYADQYGFLVETTSTAASTDYVYVVGVNGKTSTTIDGTTPSVEARVLLADGTVKVEKLALEKLKTGDARIGATSNNAAATAITLAAGDYVIKGTSVAMYDAGTDSSNAVNTKATTDLLGKTFGYTMSDEELKLELLTALPASGTPTVNETVYSATLGSAVAKDQTSYTANTDKTVLADKSTKFVVYNADKKTAVVYTGAASLPATATGTGYAVLETGTTSNVGNAKVVFVSTASGYTADTTSEYVYIDPTKFTTTLVDGSTKYIYTGVKADGTEWTSAAGDQITNNAANKGLYVFDENNKVNTTAKAITTDTTITNTYYIYDATFTVSGDLLGAGAGYYNITEDTQVVYVDSDLSEIDGNGGFMVLASKDGAATSNVAAIFVTVD